MSDEKKMMEQPQISMDKVALWLGWKEININILNEQIDNLKRHLSELQPTDNNVDLEDGTNADLEG